MHREFLQLFDIRLPSVITVQVCSSSLLKVYILIMLYVHSKNENNTPNPSKINLQVASNRDTPRDHAKKTMQEGGFSWQTVWTMNLTLTIDIAETIPEGSIIVRLNPFKLTR